jgi:peptidoglycan hydrolase CwlO-like protein
MRVHGVDRIPELIEALSKEASDTARKINEKTREIGELASAIESIVIGAETKSYNERIRAGEESLKGTKGVSISDMMRGK